MAIGDGVSALATLAVTFGGFSPTAMDGVEATREQIERVEAEQARKKAEKIRHREIERARTSSPRRMTDAGGNIWKYVLIDDRYVRIEKCTSRQSVIAIPSEIEGLPVFALGSEALAENDYVREILCPDSIEVIGACAFRLCPELRKVAFPPGVSDFNASWVSHCPNMDEIVLPGRLDKISSRIFDNPGLRKLVIGAYVHAIEPGAFEKTQLESLEIDPENPFVKTDGSAVYSTDGTTMIALARPLRAYAVADGCKRIAKKACMGIESLASIDLPASVVELGEFAFSHTSIAHFKAPSNLRTIGEKAFYYCQELVSAELNEGLESIGKSAFEETSLQGLMIPSSVSAVGTSITDRSNVRYCGNDATFGVSGDSPYLFYDGQGGLYRKADGLHFIQLMNKEQTSYSVYPGTVGIDPYALAFHDAICEVDIPRGVVTIGDSAFRICPNLRKVSIPEGLQSIGKEAFLDSRLESIHLPSSLVSLGKDALVTAGAHHVGEPPSLRAITVDPANPKFYVESGILCERMLQGDVAIVFTDDVDDVRIPQGVAHIATYAFNNARNIKTIYLGPNLKTIDSCGLTTLSMIERIEVKLENPVEGRTAYTFEFPDTPRAVHEISLAIGGSSWVNVPEMMAHYDSCLAHAHNYNARVDEGISAYEQARLIVGRLKDPILLAKVNKSMFDKILKLNIIDICVDVARHDGRDILSELVEMGYLNEDNIEAAIAAVARLQDAAVSGYLLEVKRMKFGQDAFDFDL